MASLEDRITRRFEIAIAAGGDTLYLGSLGLDETHLKEIIPLIRQIFPSLRELNLSNNRLRRLPNEITNLFHLTSIHVQRNRLTSLPETMGRMKKLLNLDLSENRLTNLPETLNDIPKIKNIYLQNNPLDLETVSWLEATLISRGANVLHNRAAFEPEEFDFQYKDTLEYLFREQPENADNIIKTIETLEDSFFAIGQEDITQSVDIIENGKKTGTKSVKIGTEPKQNSSGKNVLIEFLRKFPRNQHGVQSIYDTVGRFLLEEIQHSRDIIQEIAVYCGDCSTPIKDYLLQKAIQIATNHPEVLDFRKLETILDREALQQEICTRMKINSGDSQELLQALVNSVYLEDSENHPYNKIQIVGDRERMPSKTNYIQFGFRLVNKVHLSEFARICCKEEGGKLFKNEQGKYVLDPKKMRNIREKYKAQLGIISPKEQILIDFKKEHLALLRGNENFCIDFENENIDTTKQAHKLRIKLDGEDDETQYIEIAKKHLKDIETNLNNPVKEDHTKSSRQTSLSRMSDPTATTLKRKSTIAKSPRHPGRNSRERGAARRR